MCVENQEESLKERYKRDVEFRELVDLMCDQILRRDRVAVYTLKDFRGAKTYAEWCLSWENREDKLFLKISVVEGVNDVEARSNRTLFE